MKLLITSFVILFGLMSPLFAGMPTKLFGYKLGDPCTQDEVIVADDREIDIECATTLKQIAGIRVQFETISYKELLDATIENVGSKPTVQNPNQKVMGCDKSLAERLKSLGIISETNIDPDHHHFTGRAEWLSVQKTPIYSDPKVKLRIWTTRNFGCNDTSFLSKISLYSNEIRERNTMMNREQESTKKEESLNNLFN